MFKELKDIKEIFKIPKKKYYFGKAVLGSPYMFPWYYCNSIIKIRKLKLKTKKEYDDYVERYPHLKKSKFIKFSNVPEVRRTINFVKKIFNNYYYIEIGYPIKIIKVKLGWKDKFGSPRYEWCPQFHIYFFGLQFAIFWNAPDDDNYTYYEMIIHYLYYADKDIIKAEKTCVTTWNKKYLINLRKLKLEKLQKIS